MTTRENLQELIAIIYDLNQHDKKDWFVNFSGHVNTVEVHYNESTRCEKCGSSQSESAYITYGTKTAALSPLIEKLKSILRERQQ